MPDYDSNNAMKVVSGGSGTTADQVQGNVATGVADAGNPVAVAGIVQAVPSAAGADGTRQQFKTDSRGYLWVNLGVGGGSVLAGTTFTDGATDAVARMIAEARGMVFNGTTWNKAKKPNAVARLLSAAASTNATSVKASAGDLFLIQGRNANADARYLKLYNKASAPTVGTDTPFATYYLAPTANFELRFDLGLYFSTGIGYAFTTAAADADTGALTAADIICLNIAYA